jgi:two-component system, OmpR family, phosphate regulon sensor histidine kinase PhoR
MKNHPTENGPAEKDNEERKMQEIYNLLNEGVVEVDVHWKIHYASPAALLLLNLSASFSGIDLRSYLVENFEVKPDITKIDLKQGEIPSFDVIRNETDQFHPLFLSFHGFPAGTINNYAHLLFIIKNKTEDHLEAGIKGDFLTLISHKLRTPIVALNYAMNLIQRRKELNFTENEIEDFFHQAYFKSIEVAELIEKIIRFCSVMRDQFYSRNDSFELQDFLEEVIAKYERKYKKFRPPYHLEVQKMENITNIAMPPEYASLIFENVIDNAIKFNDKEESSARIAFQNENGIFWVSITDNGPGIPSEMHEKIFEKFFQIEKFFTGTVEGVGLGLAVIKHILQVYNQSISIESRVGAGTTIRFTLPLKK